MFRNIALVISWMCIFVSNIIWLLRYAIQRLLTKMIPLQGWVRQESTFVCCFCYMCADAVPVLFLDCSSLNVWLPVPASRLQRQSLQNAEAIKRSIGECWPRIARVLRHSRLARRLRFSRLIRLHCSGVISRLSHLSRFARLWRLCKFFLILRPAILMSCNKMLINYLKIIQCEFLHFCCRFRLSQLKCTYDKKSQT